MSQNLIRQRLTQVQDALQRLPGVYAHDLRKFVDGNVSISRQGQLKLPVALPADEFLHSRDLREVLNGEWKMLPLLLLVSADPVDPAEAPEFLPDYELVHLGTQKEFEEEGRLMHHALGHFFNHFVKNGTVAYSLRYQGHSLLSLSATSDKVVKHVVGPYNRPPTPQELQLLQLFLEARGITLCYDPTAPY